MVYSVNATCPGCGRCMCCGRHATPVYPYPWWGTQTPVYTPWPWVQTSGETSGTVIITNGSSKTENA